MFKGIIRFTSKEVTKAIFMNGDLEIKARFVLVNNRIFLETNIKHDDNLINDIELSNVQYPKDEYSRIIRKLKFALNNNKMVDLNINITKDDFLTFYNLESLNVDDFKD